MHDSIKMVREWVAASLGVETDQVQADSKFRDLVSDSLELASLMQDLEDASGIDAEEIAKFGTVGAFAVRLNDKDCHT